ncbi:transglycosylase family protein [Streptomyces sp. G-G2]|uniref:transglycosylase family protein n=1 Tax=Streptomyces sp. G-G2 TaxID=3046201 RepID=UPI0024B91B62|nr:transglycosylase family protein [Streptomyces sp. G-G2]MDJ0380418.1 transglycosylase family protein [Streptomyces sp. G-G2]
MNRKRLLSTALIGLVSCSVLCLNLTAADAASVSTWDKVADCESTGNWSINNGNGFYGGLQFTSSTWKGFGGEIYAPRADLATKQQQILIAEKVLAVQGQGAWPNCGPKYGLGNDHATPYPTDPTPAPAPAMARTVAGVFSDLSPGIAGIDANNNMKYYISDGPALVPGGADMLGSNGLWKGFKSIAAGDFNGDGKQDIAGIDAYDNMKLYTGDGAGHLGGGTNMLGSNGLWKGFKSIAAGDFNGDGKQDIAGIDAYDNMKLYTGDGAGQLGGGANMLGSTGLWKGFKSITSADFNGDGKRDIAGIDAYDNLKLYTGDGAGQLGGGTNMLGSTGLWKGFRSLVAADFSVDGKQDIAGIDANNNMMLYVGNGAGTVSGGTNMLSGPSGAWAGF